MKIKCMTHLPQVTLFFINCVLDTVEDTLPELGANVPLGKIDFGGQFIE